MPDLPVEPALPLEITVQFDTPLRITAEFLVRRPGEEAYRTFFSSRISQEVPSQVVHITLDPMPTGTELLLTAVYFGAKQTAFRTRIAFAQDGRPVGEPIRDTGSTGTKFARFREIEVTYA